MICLLSDVHANLAALAAVLDRAVKEGCTRFISLGDVVGYGAQPAECIDLLRGHDAINILGNHDSYLVTGLNCTRSKVVAGIIDFTRTRVDGGRLEWLKKSPRIHAEGRWLMIHGGPDDPTDQYLLRVSAAVVPEGFDRLFAGHTHVQALADFGGKIFCNPGSAGQPRDGDSRAAFAVLDGGKIYLRRVEYDIDATAFAMKKAGFAPFTYENLYKGAQLGGRVDKIEIVKGE